jgi:hypothetical protein
MLSHILTFLSGAAALALAQLFLPTVIAEGLRQLQAKRAADRVVALQLDPLLTARGESR